MRGAGAAASPPLRVVPAHRRAWASAPRTRAIARPGRFALLAGLAWLSVAAAHAATLTVKARDTTGAPLSDLVVVLDPLDAPAPRAAARASIDQVARTFVPRVTVLQSGTVVSFPNSDRIRHQVYSFSPAKTFNLKLYAGTEAPPITFDKAGLVVLGCNIHDTMIAFVAVVDTPYFARSGADGLAHVDAPPGRYRLRVWHPEMASAAPVRTLALPAAGESLEFSFALAPAGGAVAGFPE